VTDTDWTAPAYAIRRVGDGWTVYHWATLEPARVRGTAQVGLSREVAGAIAQFLNDEAGRVGAMPRPRVAAPGGARGPAHRPAPRRRRAFTVS
jgi:hypothetical protein